MLRKTTKNYMSYDYITSAMSGGSCYLWFFSWSEETGVDSPPPPPKKNKRLSRQGQEGAVEEYVPILLMVHKSC